MASIERTPADTWKVRYRDPSGKQRRKTFQQHSNARRFAREVEVAKDRGEFVNPHDGKVLVGDWMKQWDAARLNRRASTPARDESLIRNHLLPAFGKKTLGSVQPVDVKAFVASLARRNYSPAYIAKAYQLLAASFLAAVDEGMLPRTPCRGVALPRIEKHEMRFLSHAEVAALAETIHPRYRALVLTAAYTGLRAGELSGLHVDQLNLLRRTLTVTRTATEVRGHWSIGTPKTKASRRTVTLPKTLCEVLAAHPGRVRHQGAHLHLPRRQPSPVDELPSPTVASSPRGSRPWPRPVPRPPTQPRCVAHSCQRAPESDSVEARTRCDHDNAGHLRTPHGRVGRRRRRPSRQRVSGRSCALYAPFARGRRRGIGNQIADNPYGIRVSRRGRYWD